MSTKLALADVPVVPGDAPAQAAPNGDVVYESGLERWRYDSEAKLLYYILYAADGLTHEAVYAAPGRRR